MALAPLSQTLVLTADGSNFSLTDAVVIPIGAIAPPPTFTVAPSISPSSGTTATTFTANDGTVEDGIVTGRRWLLSGNLIGTGTTVKPSTSGSLVLEVSALGTGGVTTAKSAAVTVAAIPAPAFSGNPTISPGSGTTAATYTATDPTVSNGTITLRQWFLGAKLLSDGSTIVPGPGNSGSLIRKVTAVGTDGSTITVEAAVTVAAVTLKALTVSVSSGTVGQAISSTISGLTSGSQIELTGTGAAGLSINGAVITGTPTAAGPVYVVETLTGATNSPRTSSALITVAEPAPTPTNTYANSTRVYANNASFSPDLLDVEQRLVALGSRFTQYRVDYGSGPNTATGDTVYAALVKLQNWIAAIEADRGRAFFTDPFFANGMFARA